MTLPKDPTIATTEVRELVYQSRASTDMEPEQLEEILTVARRKNRQAGLTGLLLYHEGDFLQVLEGASDQIDEVFGVIRNDDRHHRINVVVDRVVPARSFGEWEMGFYEIHDPLDTAGGVSGFLSGAELPAKVNRYVQMLFESFRDRR